MRTPAARSERLRWRRGRTPNNAKHAERRLIPHSAANDSTESVKPRELSAAEREAQIVALWRGRPPARRGPEHVAVFCQWLSDYTPWLLPPGEQHLEKVAAIVRPHVNGE